jgi:hypothetical protein
MILLYFTTRIGVEKKQVPFPADPNLMFIDIMTEVSNKFGLSMQSLSIATPAGQVLTTSDITKLTSEVATEFGTAFDIIDQGIVGNKL